MIVVCDCDKPSTVRTGLTLVFIINGDKIVVKDTDNNSIELFIDANYGNIYLYFLKIFF